jgi:hypothetical protein
MLSRTKLFTHGRFVGIKNAVATAPVTRPGRKTKEA